MKARIFCPLGKWEGKDFLIEREAVIGRESGNEIVLPSAVVSGKHARVYLSEPDEAFWIEDLGSRNGTRLDGRPLTRPRKLGDLHVVTLADGLEFIIQTVSDDFVPGQKGKAEPQAVDATALGAAAPVLPGKLASQSERESSLQPRPEREPTVREAAPIVAPDFKPAAPSAPPAESDATSRRAAPPIAPPSLKQKPEEAPQAPPPEPTASPSKPEDTESFSNFILMTENEDGTASSYRLSPGENLIGRMDECSICIHHPTVSRRHAALDVEGFRVFLRELGGLNPVLLAGNKVEGKVEVQPDQEIQIGQVKAVLVRR